MRYTYISFLGSDDYLIGILALKNRLDVLKSEYPLTVLVSEDISNKSKRILKKYGIPYVIKKDYVPSEEIQKNNTSFGMPQWSKTFGKLYIFGMTEFDKLVYVDADMLIKKNIDELFQNKNLSAVIAGVKYPGNENWSLTLNSGLMVIVPKKNEDVRLFELIESNKFEKGGDQDIIHLAYPNWSENERLHLKEEYNLLAPYESYYVSKKLVSSDKLKVIHYIGTTKPWMRSQLSEYKHIIKIIVNGLCISSSLKGIKFAVQDYIFYCKLCRKIENDISKME